jgi:hypothetical protein
MQIALDAKAGRREGRKEGRKEGNGELEKAQIGKRREEWKCRNGKMGLLWVSI